MQPATDDQVLTQINALFSILIYYELSAGDPFWSNETKRTNNVPFLVLCPFFPFFLSFSYETKQWTHSVFMYQSQHRYTILDTPIGLQMNCVNCWIRALNYGCGYCWTGFVLMFWDKYREKKEIYSKHFPASLNMVSRMYMYIKANKRKRTNNTQFIRSKSRHLF